MIRDVDKEMKKWGKVIRKVLPPSFLTGTVSLFVFSFYFFVFFVFVFCFCFFNVLAGGSHIIEHMFSYEGVAKSIPHYLMSASPPSMPLFPFFPYS